MLGVKAEVRVTITTEPLIRTFADGTTHEVQKPIYQLQELAYGELDPNTRVSPRLAPAVIGLGLLAAPVIPFEVADAFKIR